MELYVFNPDSDMALAHNNENYLPPASIRQLAQDLALLPMWYALPGGAVLAPSAYNADYLKEMQRVFSLSVQLITEPELPECVDAQIVPWGWNLAVRKRLLNARLPERGLPTVECLEEYRRLSSREVAMGVLSGFIKEEREDICGGSDYLPLLKNCREFVEKHPACVLKAPWSGSGKGLNWCKGEFTKSVEGWCEHIIKEQGFVAGEPLYNKVEDFAMEFYSNGYGEVIFVGYSLFMTNKSGAYNGNVLIPWRDIERRISGYVSLHLLVYVRQRLCAMLSEVYGSTYVGYLGVDMMVCLLFGQRYAIHPCVEINMRMNMGVVSLLFQKRFMASGSVGRFVIEHYTTNKELQERHQQDMAAHPLQVKQGRILSGYLPLVPVTRHSLYRVFVQA